jgi:hypothetical protein
MRYKANPLRGVALEQPVAKTPLAKRMLAELGPDDFAVLKTFQRHFAAKVVHYQDAAGQVGTDPRWPL